LTATFIHPLTGFIEKTFVITEFELRKLRHDFTELITRALQPALWLLIFEQVFARSGAMHTGNIPYLDFIAPGILAQSVLFVAIFYGINVIWERDLGIVQKFLASPTPRAALVLGKGFSAGIRTLSQGVIVYSLSLLLGVKLNWNPLALFNVLVIVILAATLFSTFSLVIACIVKTRKHFLTAACAKRSPNSPRQFTRAPLQITARLCSRPFRKSKTICQRCESCRRNCNNRMMPSPRRSVTSTLPTSAINLVWIFTSMLSMRKRRC
jgi:ABC-type polysaccharide/polyol phosphate export permease